jgi:hypothetical protein
MRYVKYSDITTHYNKLTHMLPIEICRCLACEHWFRSTDRKCHRICNECKGREDHGTAHLADWRGGQRVLDNAGEVR